MKKLEEMSYGNLQDLCHPAYITGVDMENVDCYTVIAQKMCIS